MNKHEMKFRATNVEMCRALIDLLKTKRLEEISITELCIVANINRSTFYSHFGSISELKDYTKNYIIEKCRESVKEMIPKEFIGDGNFKPSKENIRNIYLVPFLTSVKEHREVFAIKEFSNLSEMFVNNQNRLIERIFSRENCSERERRIMEYYALYFLSGVDAISKNWINSGCKDSVEEMCDIITQCIPYSFE